jgi:tetratricopeptide (TPR) repeat protein
MAGVFLSYDRDDTDKARPIAIALEKSGHSVWWDLHVRGGAQFSKVIDEALKAADVVVVLWTQNSVESAWVRDEAAVGRDSGRLVPVTLDGTQAPLGFRQFQTIDLSRWRGRGTGPLAPLLATLETFDHSKPNVPKQQNESRAKRLTVAPRGWLAAAVAVVILVTAGVGAWSWMSPGGLPVVEVAAANGSARSQAAASDLFVKLGTLAQVGEGKWKLVDASSAPSKPEFVFRTADLGSPQSPQANLVLLDGSDDSLLWSREFTVPAGGEGDLRQQMALIAGRVLGCALESRDAGGVRRDLLKLFLDSCATLAESSFDEPTKVRAPLRSIVEAAPRFMPAWERLLYADVNTVDFAGSIEHRQEAVREMRSDMEKARRLDPDLPQLTLAELRLLPPTDYAKPFKLLARALERAPNDAGILVEQALELQRVGRMFDGVAAARRAAELDPLSPPRDLILSLAAAGQLEAARQELERAARFWPRTGALRDAMWAFHLRYGDPRIAKRYATFEDPGLDLFLEARIDPTPANVQKLIAFIRQYEKRPATQVLSFTIQALGEFNQIDDVIAWIGRTPTEELARDSYILFRPSLAGLRRDPRFMAIAKRIGLLDYWQSSGRWPDFCDDPTLPYDCKTEAAKLG